MKRGLEHQLENPRRRGSGLVCAKPVHRASLGMFILFKRKVWSHFKRCTISSRNKKPTMNEQTFHSFLPMGSYSTALLNRGGGGRKVGHCVHF